MLSALWTLLLAMLVACGGGGGSAQGGAVVPLPAVLRTDLLFGYFAQTSPTIVESQGHTNYVAAPDMAGPSDQMAGVMQAMATGQRVAISMPLCLVPLAQGESEARTWLQRLHAAGLLAPVVAVTWCDEPNTARAGMWSDANALAMNAAVRRAMATFPELHAALKVIYACTGNYPGAATFDWIGCDDYDSGCAVLTRWYPTLPGAHHTVHPGGASKPGGGWKQDPACFLSYAENNPSVVLIEPFIYQTVVDTGTTYVGIRENGMLHLYCQAGRTVVAPGQPDGCA